MIKKIILILSLTAFNATAQETYVNQMLCESTDVVFQSLKRDYGEIPVVLGKADDVAGSTMSIWTNPKTNSWSIVATKGETSCIIGVGDNLKIIEYKRKKSV